MTLIVIYIDIGSNSEFEASANHTGRRVVSLDVDEAHRDMVAMQQAIGPSHLCKRRLQSDAALATSAGRLALTRARSAPPKTTLVVCFKMQEGQTEQVANIDQQTKTVLEWVEMPLLDLYIEKMVKTFAGGDKMLPLFRCKFEEQTYRLTGLVYNLPGHFSCSFLLPDRENSFSWHYYDDMSTYFQLNNEHVCTFTDNTQIGLVPAVHPLVFALSKASNKFEFVLLFGIYTATSF